MKNILCFGDSNTWGYNPKTGERFPEGVRWTSILQNRLGKRNVTIIEEGLCGRTTVYEDEYRPNRKGIDSIRSIFEKNESIDMVIFMLGTNDCKTFNHSSAEKIAHGVDQCLDIILEYVPANQVLLISPIHLGENVWKPEYDPEFDQNSVLVLKGLKQAYLRVVHKRGVRFLAASDYVSPSADDQEHLDSEGHRILAELLLHHISFMSRKCV